MERLGDHAKADLVADTNAGWKVGVVLGARARGLGSGEPDKAWLNIDATWLLLHFKRRQWRRFAGRLRHLMRRAVQGDAAARRALMLGLARILLAPIRRRQAQAATIVKA